LVDKWSDGDAVWTEGSAKSWMKVNGCADPQNQRIGRWYVHVVLFCDFWAFSTCRVVAFHAKGNFLKRQTGCCPSVC
jgi:hypothetical protein